MVTTTTTSSLHLDLAFTDKAEAVRLRGLDLRQVHLNIIDGSQSLRAGARKYSGDRSPILRCQLHKRRNIVGHFADEEQPGWDRRLANAYDLRSYREAKAALLRIQRLRKRAKTGIRLGARTWPPA